MSWRFAMLTLVSTYLSGDVSPHSDVKLCLLPTWILIITTNNIPVFYISFIGHFKMFKTRHTKYVCFKKKE